MEHPKIQVVEGQSSYSYIDADAQKAAEACKIAQRPYKIIQGLSAVWLLVSLSGVAYSFF